MPCRLLTVERPISAPRISPAHASISWAPGGTIVLEGKRLRKPEKTRTLVNPQSHRSGYFDDAGMSGHLPRDSRALSAGAEAAIGVPFYTVATHFLGMARPAAGER